MRHERGIGIFAGVIALAAACAPAAAQDAQRFVGVFDGSIFSSGSHRPGATSLRPTADGRLVGDYSFTEPGGEVTTGELAECRAQARRLSCRWADPYGVGDLEMEFSPDYAAFRGRWRADNARGRWNPWSGRRRTTS